MTLRVGSLIYSCNNGLGILARDFCKHGVITDPMVIRHGTHPHQDWHPNAPIISDLRGQRAEMEAHCRSCDVMLFLETPFAHELVTYCKEHGVKTAIMPMHECWHKATSLPNLFLCPSLLDVRALATWYVNPMRPFLDIMEEENGTKVVFAPVPVEVKWRQRTEARIFVHNAGHGGLRGRNGTAELLEAWKLIKSPATLILRSQSHGNAYVERFLNSYPSGATVDHRTGTFDYATLWEEGDVFVFPEKFNGLSLPLQEARAAGMLVMCGDRFPMNTWLPKEPLIPVSGNNRARIGPAYLEFDEAQFSPEAIAATVDAWYGYDVSVYSLQGREWAETMSWAKLGPQYIQVLEELCRS